MKKIIALTMGDLRNIRRDPLLFPVLFVPIIFLVLLRYGVPLANGILLEQLQFDLTPHYVFIVSFAILLTPLVLGTLAGFMILDDRDEEILNYFAVTPLSKAGYLLFRIVSSVVVSVGVGFLIIGLTDLIEPEFTPLIPLILLAALEAPMLALFMGAFASNKVEGLAIGKAMGIIFIAPFIGYLVPSRWSLLAGIFPTYWVSMGFTSIYSGGSGYAFYLTGGILVHAWQLWWLVRRFNRRIN